ncbi:uncharacterized protein GLRG_07787 [Colletotrichum graminicola M1.001]|uniref:Rhodopsin domain-containing protein n=1 Tax=Colletotrichum graminicola (strain M1.001 / M2 / FGSC 10212) TaxID=645133 RepID=E3QNN0_COLGM|nr:uncharacterized protein GLRG_07787 [Colletotrichum graminicola M1.001]EFQ32517.1 hypothetical protein GLRG_07787 [Colletotrichum graminicola M1.001]
MAFARNNTLDFDGPPAVVIIAVEFTLVGIAAILIAARIYLRIGLQGLPPNASDIIVCAAWITCAAFSSFDIAYLDLDVLRPDLAFTLQGYGGTSDKIEFVWKLQWASQFPFFTAFYLCKAALLTLYARLFPPFMKIRRRILWATMVYCGCAYTATILMVFFICRPLKANWVTDPAVACPVDVFFRLFQIAWALNFAADIAIFCLPFLVLYRLQLKQSVKISVYCTFLIGLVNLGVTLARLLGIQLSPSRGYLRSFTTIELWSALDVNIGLVIACLPPLRPYLSYSWGTRSSHSSTQTTPKEPGGRSELSGSTLQRAHYGDKVSSSSEAYSEFVAVRIAEEGHCDVEAFAASNPKPRGPYHSMCD